MLEKTALLAEELPSKLIIGGCLCQPNPAKLEYTSLPRQHVVWLDTKKSFFKERSKIKIQHQDQDEGKLSGP